MRTALAAVGLLALCAMPAAAQQRYEPYSEWPHNAFGPAPYHGGGDVSFDTVQFFEGACAIGSVISIAVPAAGYACIPSQLMGLGQMFQPQQRERQYAEVRPRPHVARVERSDRTPHTRRVAITSDVLEREFPRLMEAYLEKNNLMVVPRVERVPMPAPAPRVEAPKPVLIAPVKAAKVHRAVFTRSAILRGDLLVESPTTRLALREKEAVPEKAAVADIDTRLIRTAISVMK